MNHCEYEASVVNVMNHRRPKWTSHV